MRLLLAIAALALLTGCPPHPNGAACARYPSTARAELMAP